MIKSVMLTQLVMSGFVGLLISCQVCSQSASVPVYWFKWKISNSLESRAFEIESETHSQDQEIIYQTLLLGFYASLSGMKCCGPNSR